MPNLIAFVIASILFIQVPGPSLLFTLGRALTCGRRAALLSVIGNALGLLVQVLAVAVGLGALVAASATAYSVLKVVGAAYVVYLGIQAIRHRGDARRAMSDETVARSESVGTALRTGFIVGVTNPKTVVFFGTFLPQFVDAGRHTALQMAGLGLLFSAMAVASDSIWALAAGRARAWFGRRPERLDTMSVAGGVMMIGLGGVLAASE